MIKKILILIAFIFIKQSIIAQTNETCESPIDDQILVLNSISKCSIEENVSSKVNSKDTKQVKQIQVSTRRRVVRNRDAVSGISKMGASHKIAGLKQKASLVGSLDLSNEDVLENVPFNLVQEIPLFKGCEKVSITEQEACFKKEISNHVRKNFRYPKEAFDKSVQGRVYIQFVIDKTGTVDDLSIRGPYEGDLLEQEASRIIKKLPKFTPGKHNGRAVKVKYGLPINFRIPGKKASNVKPNGIHLTNDKDNSDYVAFADVEQIPTFKDCAMVNDVSNNCFNREIIKHVNKNFIYPDVAVKNRIEGKIITYFVIDKKGNVTNIRTIKPDNCNNCEVLEEAAKNLFKSIPNLIPGRDGGKLVNTKHAFPLDFKLN